MCRPLARDVVSTCASLCLLTCVSSHPIFTIEQLALRPVDWLQKEADEDNTLSDMSRDLLKMGRPSQTSPDGE
jgi:hypothetical protein